MKYKEKLRDLRWQKKRLEVLERDDWKCRDCRDPGTMLTAHHTNYDKELDPWEYPDEQIVTLCEFCHKDEHETFIAKT